MVGEKIIRKRVREKNRIKPKDRDKAKNASKATTDQQPQPDTTAPPPSLEQPELPLLQTMSSHWFVRYLVPLYLLYAAVEGHWSLRLRILQDPKSIQRWLPFLQLRESVGHDEERQLLIVGTMSSGTRQIAESLHTVLGLEMGHEMSDTLSNFVRDGTVSWIFGIRFLPAPPVLKIAELCQQATYAVGFHPRMYRGNRCSQNQQWSKCWAQECVDILQMEWGCALQKGGCSSFQPHRKSLHQTRNPIAVIESLVAKFCHTPDHRKDFVRISALLFSHSVDFDSLSCLEAVAHHVMEYNRALLRARQRGVLHGMYQIERATPCQVAEWAGLATRNDAVHPPNHDRFVAECRSGASGGGHRPMTPKKKYKVNQDRVRLDWADFEGGKHQSARPAGDRSLVDALKNLTRDLLYDA